MNHKTIAAKLAEIEARMGANDEQLAAGIEGLRRFTALYGPRRPFLRGEADQSEALILAINYV